MVDSKAGRGIQGYPKADMGELRQVSESLSEVKSGAGHPP